VTKEEYEKVFQHINDLAQKNALGKIPHQTMYDGLKKLLEELIATATAHSVKIDRRRAFWRGFFTSAGFFTALAYVAFVLWQKGWLREWMKGMRF